MRYITFAPSKKLENYVRFFWILESESTLERPYIYRSMADSCTEILFHYHGTFDEISSAGKTSGSFLSGIHAQTQRFRRFVTTGQFGIFGAYLYPYAVKHLFNLPPAGLTDQMPDIYSALGKEGKDLEEQIMLARDNRKRCRILSRFFEKKLSCHVPEQHPAIAAVKYVTQSKNLHPVGVLAHMFNLSERQFERKFREYSGFNPKLCMRIIRFGEACNRYGLTNQKSLTEIGYECGYYDQSHFIHDFKEFSGYEPGEYFSGTAEGVEWRENETALQ